MAAIARYVDVVRKAVDESTTVVEAR